MSLPDTDSKQSGSTTASEPPSDGQAQTNQGYSIAGKRRDSARDKAQSQRLSAEEYQQLREQLRLSYTRLDAVQSELDKVSESIRMHEAYVDLSVLYQEVQEQLFYHNKAIASLKGDEQRLARFEICETAMPTYLTVQITDSIHQAYRTQMAKKKEQARIAKTEAETARSKMDTAKAAMHESALVLSQREEAMQTGFRTDGLREAIASEMAAQNILLAHINELRSQFRAKFEECKTELLKNEEQITALQTTFAPLNSNIQAKENLGAILVYLDTLQTLLQRKEALLQEQKRLAARQRDLNNRLGTLFMQDQKLEERLATLQSEITMHREVNHGIDGQNLQTRVITLRARKQELMAAQKLWTDICSVWQQIECTKNKMRILQQETERDETEIEKLEMSTRALQAEANQRRYDYTLSKGQNVIRLRSDLREGVACTVCGATNHPFHSDTMLEQNKLIGEWKSEADKLDMNLKQTQETLLKEQLANAMRQGVVATLSDELERMNDALREYIRQWKDYEALDTSLSGCNPATMSESRIQTIRGLIETCQRDETTATEQLNTFNYHQLAINQVAVNIDSAENERAELHTALSETNTGCQVLASQTEIMRSDIRSVENEYQNIYNKLDALIDISDWHQKWLKSNDSFKSRLRAEETEWERLADEIKRKKNIAQSIKGSMHIIDRIITDLETVAGEIAARLALLNNQDKQAESLYARLFGDNTAMSTFIASKKLANRNMELWEEAVKHALATIENSSRLQGIGEEAVEYENLLSETVGNARSALDDWMYNFRLEGNPPCRLEELNELFDTANDWNVLRNQIREVRRQYDISDLHETELRGKMLAAQQGASESQSASRKESLLKQRRDILLAIAKLEQRLQAHEDAVKRLEVFD